MNYETDIRIVDSMMGGGKTSAAINYINSSDTEHILYITPYLSEIEERIVPLCRAKRFVTPSTDESDTKMEDLEKLITDGRNIAATHALFRRFTPRTIKLLRSVGYTLIMDEVADVIEVFNISPGDLRMLENEYVTVDENTGQLNWRNHGEKYEGVFSKVRYLCSLHQLYKYGSGMVLRLFPVNVFKAFRKVFILTYMFNAQIQRYYYDFCGVKYKYSYVRRSESGYEFTDEPQPSCRTIDYRKLIHIVEHKKLNSIGEKKTALSKSWYNKASPEALKKLKNNVVNFFINIAGTKSEYNLWTTFKDYMYALRGKGYTKGFIPCTARATNQWRERTAVAYTINVYMNTVVHNFFTGHGIKIDEDSYALSEMLQCIWRSAIRDGKEIMVYVPSSRMRKLLTGWIEENSPEVSCEDESGVKGDKTC